MHSHKALIGVGALFSFALFSFIVLTAPLAHADTSSTVNLRVNIPTACSLTPAEETITKEFVPGTAGPIGTASLKAVCNDPGGFAIYTIGYTNNTHGNTDLVAIISGEEAPSIHTGLGNSGASNWNMTVSNANIPGNYTATIENSFDRPHVVPDVNTKIATVDSATDQATGTNLSVAYNAYIAPNQYPGTYQGKVKFTLVHPTTHSAPVSRPATLDTGRNVNAKMKSMAAGSTKTYDFVDELIKSIQASGTLPNDFVPSDANTISLPDAENPVYIFFDNTNGAGIMYIYSGNATPVMNPDSSYLFNDLRNLYDATGISIWDAHLVTDMNHMFCYAGKSTSYPFELDLASWDVSNVTNMSNMFQESGQSTQSWTINGLSNWDTSSVTNMNNMFSFAGQSAAPTWSLDLSSWDTSNVTNMNGMFRNAGQTTPSNYILDVSSWDTSNVTDMANMFQQAGQSATNQWVINGLSNWDTSSVVNMSNMFSFAGRSINAWSLDLSSWDTSGVTNMSGMFQNAGQSSIDGFTLNVASWNTSNVTNMSNMFRESGQFSKSWTINGLSNWNTSNVTNMNYMFGFAGKAASSFEIDLSSWNTERVTDMGYMFRESGQTAVTWAIGDISSWDTSNVENMSHMFSYVSHDTTNFKLDLSSWNTSKVTDMDNMCQESGQWATTWSIIIPRTNGNSINNTTSQMFGSTSSTYASPISGKSFTLAP